MLQFSALDGTDPMLLWQAHIGCGISLAKQGKLAEPPKGLALFEDAADQYRTAAEVISDENYPIQSATTWNNLGVVKMNMAKEPEETKKAARLDEAIGCFEAALDVHTRDDFPLKWAMAKDNLGNALSLKGQTQSGPEAQDIFRLAIAAHEEALLVYERERYPLLWAHTKGNLGLDWTHLSAVTPSSDAPHDRKVAEENFHAALEVLVPEDQPFHHARVLANLATLYEKTLNTTACENPKELLTLTRGHLETARRIFIEFGVVARYATKAGEAAVRLDGLLTRMGS